MVKKIIVLCLIIAAPFVVSVNNGESQNKNFQKTIVLTFDDGPKPKILKELLPLLKKHDIPATFFVIGSAATQNKNLLKEIDEAGHEIENHSYCHKNFKKLFKEKGAPGVKKSLMKCDEIILQATGKKPKFFRPPFWEINGEIEKIIRAEGYTVLKLSKPDINTLDYDDFSQNRSPEALNERVKNLIASREQQGKFQHILVFHELPLTIKSLIILIPYFKTLGYEFSRLDKIKSF